MDEALIPKERRSSVYPRMAVSDDVECMFDELCDRHHVKTRGKLGNAIETDSDGTPFINYLSAPSILERIRNRTDEPLEPLTTMVQHRKGIDEMLEWGGDAIRSDELLGERYGWLISYRNRIVRGSGVGDPIDPSVLDRDRRHVPRRTVPHQLRPDQVDRTMRMNRGPTPTPYTLS